MFKKFLEKKGITDEAFQEMSAVEVAKLQTEYNNELAENLGKQIRDAAKSEDLDTVKQRLDTFLEKASKVNDEVIVKLQGQLKTQGELIEKFKENGAAAKVTAQTLKEIIKAGLVENKELFEELKENKGARLNLTVKAAGTMLTGTNLTPAGNRIARTETMSERVGFVRRNPFMLDIVATSNTNAKIVYWVELVNEDGTVAMTAEGAVKSQVDWDYVERSAEVRKMTAFTKVSKEMLDDIDGFAADIERELTERMLLFLDDRVLNADGTGIEISGVATNATAFAAGGLALSVDQANEMDVLRAAIAQVYRSEFEASYCVIHPDKAAQMDLSKGTDGHYLLPPFTSANGTTVSGVPVIANTNIGADVFFVGDFSRYKFKMKEDINITIGYDGDDWTKNLITPIAEMRGVGFIPANHYGAIVTGTFTAAAAALETV